MRKQKERNSIWGRGGRAFTFFLVYTHDPWSDINDCSVCNHCTVQIRYVSLCQCNQAGCLRWSSSWAPSLAVSGAACGRWRTSPQIGLAGACGESRARRRAPDLPQEEAPQPVRRPPYSSQSNHVVDLGRGKAMK